MKLQHQALALFVVFIWGTNFVFIRVGLDELPPFTFAALRFFIVAFPLLLFFPRPKIAWVFLVAYGVLIGFGQFGLLFWAMQENISPGLASLIIQIQVFFTILLSAALMSETVNAKQMAALFLCLVGLAVIIVFTDGETTAIGIMVILVAALSWALGNVVVKQAGSVNALGFIVWSALFSIPPLALMAWFYEGPTIIVDSISHLSWQGWGVVLWQSVGNTLIGYGLWNMLLVRYHAALVAPWALLVPVFGMSASAIMLGELMPWWKLLAIGLILAGLSLNMWSNRPKLKVVKR
ncbi:MAG: O-acetylserine/cysteine efflux transporter [Arenicella sp.]|jgi:O-acetylserine/cysteine efflux transporter